MKKATLSVAFCLLLALAWWAAAAPAPIPSSRWGTKAFENSIGMKFVRIPAGKFLMGSPAAAVVEGPEAPQREVEISKPYFLGPYEVTQGEYQKVVGSNPSSFKGPDTASLPVDSTNWADAVAFCAKLSALPAERRAGRAYRLPTEAEWEYACRAGTTTTYHTGNNLPDNLANISGSRMGKTSKVGTFPPNAFGVYDMHGNVAEWCSDWYDGNYYRTGPRKDPPGPAAGTSRMLRGGCYADSAVSCRSARRISWDPNHRYNCIGFRVVCFPTSAPR